MNRFIMAFVVLFFFFISHLAFAGAAAEWSALGPRYNAIQDLAMEAIKHRSKMKGKQYEAVDQMIQYYINNYDSHNYCRRFWRLSQPDCGNADTYHIANGITGSAWLCDNDYDRVSLYRNCLNSAEAYLRRILAIVPGPDPEEIRKAELAAREKASSLKARLSDTLFSNRMNWIQMCDEIGKGKTDICMNKNSELFQKADACVASMQAQARIDDDWYERGVSECVGPYGLAMKAEFDGLKSGGGSYRPAVGQAGRSGSIPEGCVVLGQPRLVSSMCDFKQGVQLFYTPVKTSGQQGCPSEAIVEYRDPQTGKRSSWVATRRGTNIETCEAGVREIKIRQ